MITLEVRRHSLRKNTGGSQLSQAGVELARKVGESIGPFAVVATSVSPRTRETAVAMGFAVDQECVTLATDPGVYAESEQSPWWLDEHPFAALAKVLETGGAYHRYAHAMAALWRDLLTPLADGQAVLVVGHSGELEAGLVACLPEADHRTWGKSLACCEGARLTFDTRFRTVEFLRLP